MARLWPLGHAFTSVSPWLGPDRERLGDCAVPGCVAPAVAHEPNETPLWDALKDVTCLGDSGVRYERAFIPRRRLTMAAILSYAATLANTAPVGHAPIRLRAMLHCAQLYVTGQQAPAWAERWTGR